MPLPFQAFLDEHGPVVYRFLVARVGPDEAQDCFQDTFLSALRAYPGLRSHENVRGWVLRIAERKAIDAHRARSRRPAPQEVLPERGESQPAPTDPDLWSKVRSLPAKQRAAMVLRYVNDLPYAQIGQVLGSSEDAARQSVRAGLAKLRNGWPR